MSSQSVDEHENNKKYRKRLDYIRLSQIHDSYRFDIDVTVEEMRVKDTLYYNTSVKQSVKDRIDVSDLPIDVPYAQYGDLFLTGDDLIPHKFTSYGLEPARIIKRQVSDWRKDVPLSVKKIFNTGLAGLVITIPALLFSLALEDDFRMTMVFASAIGMALSIFAMVCSMRKISNIKKNHRDNTVSIPEMRYFGVGSTLYLGDNVEITEDRRALVVIAIRALKAIDESSSWRSSAFDIPRSQMNPAQEVASIARFAHNLERIKSDDSKYGEAVYQEGMDTLKNRIAQIMELSDQVKELDQKEISKAEQEETTKTLESAIMNIEQQKMQMDSVDSVSIYADALKEVRYKQRGMA